jgi:ketosteroid isomerase-like protein
MVASQTAGAAKTPDVVRGTGPNPQEFKLMAVYGDIALATDHTIFKAADTSGNLSVTSEARVLRMFVKENGKWRPAGAALVRIAQ